MAQSAKITEALRDILQSNKEILDALNKLEAKTQERKKQRQQGKVESRKDDYGDKVQRLTIVDAGEHGTTGSRTGNQDADQKTPLTLEMLAYAQHLRSKSFSQINDNRLCYKFETMPDQGSVSQKALSIEKDTVSGSHKFKSQKSSAEKGQSVVSRPQQAEVAAQSSPDLRTYFSSVLNQQFELLQQMDISKVITCGFAMSLNLLTGEPMVISVDDIARVEAEARESKQPVIILVWNPTDMTMKLKSGRELFQEILQSQEDGGSQSDLLKKFITMLAEKDSIPLTEIFEMYGELMSTFNLESLLGSHSASHAVDATSTPGQPKTTQKSPVAVEAQSKPQTRSPLSSKAGKSDNSSRSAKSGHSSGSAKSAPAVGSSTIKNQTAAQTQRKPGSTADANNQTGAGEGTKAPVANVAGSERRLESTRETVRPNVSQTQAVRSPNVQRQASPMGSNLAGQTKQQNDTHNEEAEPVYIDEQLWTEIANQQMENGANASMIREKGMDTIFCLDLSDSMKGEPWKQATAFIKGFIEGIQGTTLIDPVYEHVGLVTFGSETVVQQHMTCDYIELLRKLGKLSPSGPSPLFAGMTMVYAAMNGAGSFFVSGGYKISPRVYLLSDGRLTPAKMIAGPDRCCQNEQEMEKFKVSELALSLHKKFGITLNVVPLGDFDMGFLERLSSSTGGKIIPPGDWEPQTRSFRNYLLACKVPMVAGLGALSGLANQVDLISILNPTASTQDKIEMEEFLKTHKKVSGSDSDSDSEMEEVPDYPPLGSRVSRNLSLCPDLENLGTVTKHMNDGFIGVTWDRPNSNGTIHEKMKYVAGFRSVFPSKEPVNLKNELIAVGCRVKRGADWRYSDQDGGAENLGSVFSVRSDGIVRVRWDNGHKNTYRFGQDGRYFDLEIVNERPSPTQNPKPKKEPDEPVDLVEEMNKKNKANSQSILDCGPFSASDRARSERESLAIIKNSGSTAIIQTGRDSHDTIQTIAALTSATALGTSALGIRATAAQANATAAQARATAAQANTTASQARATAAQANTTASQARATAAQANTTASQARATAAQARAVVDQIRENAAKARETDAQTSETGKASANSAAVNRNQKEYNSGKNSQQPVVGERQAQAGTHETSTPTEGPVRTSAASNSGARPKTVASSTNVKWSWNNNGVWNVYPPEISAKIEMSLKRNPNGTALVKVGSKSYRIVFGRMEQVNVETKEKFPVKRKE